MTSQWQEIKIILNERLRPGIFKVWIKPLQGEVQDGRLILTAPNEFVVSWVRDRLADQIRSAAASHLGFEPELVLRAEKKDTGTEANAPLIKSRNRSEMELPVQTPGPKTRKVSWRHSFNDFVVGSSNQLAYAACTSLCRTNFEQDNLFLCSGPGLGKTHLAQAIGNELCEQKQQASINVVYASSEQFANQMVRALKSKDLDSFKKRYRENVDLLLLEDIHFFQSKEKMQEELLSLIKALEENGSKVVFTSSFLPRELKEVDNQLASYFCSGLLAPIEKPDYDVRMRVLQNKARNYQIDIPEDISHLVASSITQDIRQLESCVRNMAMKARLLNQKICQDLVQDVLQHYALECTSLDLEKITEHICKTFELSRNKLCSRSRKKQIVLARNAAFYMARQFTSLSLKDIGKQFNRRHSTVLKGIANIEREISLDTTVGRQVTRIAEQAKQA